MKESSAIRSLRKEENENDKSERTKKQWNEIEWQI